MLLESKVTDRCTLVIDCETVGGIDKGSLTVVSHPDKVVPQAIGMIRGLAEELGASLHLENQSHPPAKLRVEFTVKVDSNAVVQVARNGETGQFKVTLEWDGKPA